MIKGNLSGLMGVVVLGFLLVGLAQAAEFSAMIVTTIGGEKLQGKIYVKGDKMRREYSNPSGITIFIVPGDQDVMWMLDPKVHTYRELPFDKDAAAKDQQQPKFGRGSKLVGSETLHGFATDKYKALVNTPTGTRPGSIWFSKKLGGPIRIETDDKSFVQEYKDIKEGGVDDALFAIPPGYQKKATPPGAPKK
jgi:outer membrane lipoprotein-sorting protein